MSAKQKPEAAKDVSHKLDFGALSFDVAADALMWGGAILRAASKIDDIADRALLVDAANFLQEWSVNAVDKVTLTPEGSA